MKRLVSHSQSWRCAALLAATSLIGLCCRAAVAQPAPGNVPAPQGAVGQPEPGYLGIVGDDRQENGAGIRVVEIESGGPAASGGLKEDDLIVAVGGKAVHSTADMGSILQPLPPGSKVSFEVERNGAKQTVTVTLGTRPAPDQRRFARFGRVPEEPLPDPNANPNGPGPGVAPNPPAGIGTPNLGNPPIANPRNDVLPEPPERAPRLPPSALVTPQPGARKQLLGVRTQPVSEEIRRRLRLLSTSGAWVVSRVLDSPAEKAGIPLDAVITAFGDAPVESPEDLARLVNQAGAGKSVRITYFSRGRYASSDRRAGLLPGHKDRRCAQRSSARRAAAAAGTAQGKSTGRSADRT